MPPIQARTRPGLPTTIHHDMLGEMRVPGFADVERAARALAPHIVRTPLLRNARLDELAGAPVWLKPECLQVTGSFKARGALNALLAMEQGVRARGVIAYSTGNHGQAIAWAARRLGVEATIVMPADAPRNKVERALAQGARVVHYDRRHESRETIGMRLLDETGGTLVPPGDHPDVLAAQGTVALEALEDLPAGALANLGTFAAPCGGGGMIAGCGLAIEAMHAGTRLVAAEPAGFDDTVRSLQSGRRETNAPGATSLCDALQAVTPAELPFAINGRYLDAACAVTDAEVIAAVRFALEELRLLVEPGGAVALAALLAGRIDLAGRDAVLVLSGGNVDLSLLQTMLQSTAAAPHGT
ncbi:threonine dehydratase [Cupriavidus gilardii J11]|uniref:Threonine dehydratase n=1 Tax=Cupriavidus gilardii J11 TaxID=936133 RepID=A0A562BTV7_9BURK|nr:threonine dehydratase [Cupriavidus gilardii J11]